MVSSLAFYFNLSIFKAINFSIDTIESLCCYLWLSPLIFILTSTVVFTVALELFRTVINNV